MKKLIYSTILLAAFLLSLLPSRAGTTISGLITDAESGEPLPGVNIILKGTAIGTVSQLDGTYQMEIDAADGILVFSFIG